MQPMSDVNGEDPLVSAVPPATDYMTYLTLLEYQLKPSNLSTLNRLLSSDDGTLAREIGWDLLRLVLPMLHDVLEEAGDCLQIIARKGNPREVVIRVAEELEKVGALDGCNEENENESDDEDGLPTFAGEATRIHLGQMRLDGMSQADEATPARTDEATEQAAGSQDIAESDALMFAALLNILSIIHPRIKTRYPSRFLATSLPAAFGAYRRLPITEDTTRAFLRCLTKLSGKQQPALPPRAPTHDHPASSATSTAPLPDPESAEEEKDGIINAYENEQVIILRLLQAVLLEILDEYLGSLQSNATPTMMWTKRLREKCEPGRIVPGKETEVDKLKTDPSLSSRSRLVEGFTELSRQLSLNPVVELRFVTGQEERVNQAVSPQEATEYPTLPSQVPIPTTGLLALAAARLFASSEKFEVGQVDMVSLCELVQPLSPQPLLPSPTVQDALCSLLYLSIINHESISATGTGSLIAMLTQTFVISPHPQTRDDAHHIATKLLREMSDSSDRLDTIKQIIRCTYTSSDGDIPLAPPYSEGTLKAIGVDWLKDQISIYLRRPPSTTHSPKGIDPIVLETDRDLNALVLPRVPDLTEDEDCGDLTRIPSRVDPDITTSVLLSLPYYISILNLICIIFSSTPPLVLPNTVESAAAQLGSLHHWKNYLVEQMATDEAVRDSASDVWALEDAVGRAAGVLTRTRRRESM